MRTINGTSSGVSLQLLGGRVENGVAVPIRNRNLRANGMDANGVNVIPEATTSNGILLAATVSTPVVIVRYRPSSAWLEFESHPGTDPEVTSGWSTISQRADRTQPCSAAHPWWPELALNCEHGGHRVAPPLLDMEAFFAPRTLPETGTAEAPPR